MSIFEVNNAKIMQKYLPLFLLITSVAFAQVPIDLFQQFNGKYNHTAIGNTLNIHDNSLPISIGFCDVLNASSANLTLTPGQNIIAAYLYWSGPVNTEAPAGNQMDIEVTLNGVNFIADDTFVYTLDMNHQYFASYVDITDLAISTGAGIYDFTNLDLSFLITSPFYCSSNGGNQTNYGGWAISFIYEDLSLPYYQISLFHGLDGVSLLSNYIAIPLNNLNVIDDIGAQIHFLAWEGDENLANGESIFINGNLISNPPLNPPNNAFNGTNSYTNLGNLNNMDLDFYDIQNNISPGDTSALIEIRSLQDLVMINNVVTVLNSQLPDATVAINEAIHTCDNEQLLINYTISNINSTDFLAANTPIAFYIDGVLLTTATTLNDIAIGDSEAGNITITLPNIIASTFTLLIIVDDDGTGANITIETDETNNTATQTINLLLSPVTTILPNLELCDEGNDIAIFNLTQQENLLTIAINTIVYYETYNDAVAEINEVIDAVSYENISNPQTIYVRINNDDCSQIISFEISIITCLCDDLELNSGFSPNGDGFNDTFTISCINDVFENYTFKIYNRYGTLVFEGNRQNIWDGHANRGLTNKGSLLPVGTYYYVFNLYDARNPNLITGWVYLNY